MKFFNVDGPLYKLMSTLTDILVLSICWLIGSIPVFTVGVSTVALFDVTLRMVNNEEGYVAKQFFKAYKSNFKQGVGLGLITILCGYVMFLYSQILKLSSDGSIMLMVAALVTGYLFLVSLIYAYPLIARYENTVFRTLKNSARISFKYFGRTLLMIVIVGVEVGTFWWNLTMMFIGILIGPACIAFTISAIAKPIFLEIEKDNRSRQ